MVQIFRKTDDIVTLHNILLPIGLRLGEFPIITQRVNGIPIKTAESILINISTRIMLYQELDSYNTRAVSTLTVENFFSHFQEMDSTGNGHLTAKGVSRVMKEAMLLEQIKLESTRSAYNYNMDLAINEHS